MMYDVCKYVIIAVVIQQCLLLQLESFVFQSSLPSFRGGAFTTAVCDGYEEWYNRGHCDECRYRYRHRSLTTRLASSAILGNDRIDDNDIYSFALKEDGLSKHNYDDKTKSHELFTKFSLIQGIITEKYSRDNYFCSKLHLSTIKTLIQSDKEHHIDRESNDHLPTTGIPPTYLMTIAFMRNITDFLTTSYHPCEKLVKIIIKKESISKYMQYDEVEERMTSLTGGTTLLMSVRELIDFERKVERVLSLVLLTLFTYKQIAQSGTDSRANGGAYLYFSRLLLEKLTTHEKHFAMIVLSRGILSTGFNFSPVKHALDVQGLYQSSTYPDTGLQDIFQSGMSHFGMRSPSNNYKLLFPFASACLRSFCRSDMYPTGGAFEDTGSRTDAVNQRELDEAGFKGSVEEWRLCRMFRSLYEFDAESSSDYGLTDQADDLLIYMRRWIVELVSMHFINEDFSNREALTEEIRTNTVAMELICTSDAFVEGTKSDRKRYNHVIIEIGRYLNVMCTMTNEFTKGITDESHMNSNTEYSTLTNVKKLMMIISSLKWLPISSKVRKAIEQKFDLKKMHDLYSIVPTVSSARFQDDELFYGSSDSSSSSNSLTVDLEEKNRRLIEDIDKLLLQSISELLELSPEMLRSPRVLEEVDSIFSTWRRPYLLFDYYKMHCNNKDIRPLYVRFLKALFGISEETFDDIRFKDSKNKRHLDLFDPLLVKQWMEGRATDGTALPGYNDPQTFMMLGEDTHTCMTIRSRQKGTNRGLLSILLNGSCRIVGVKDSAGRLLSRSIVRLLVDELTSRPVLFVDTPYGLHDSSADCSIDVYDQAAELGRLLGVPVVYAKPPPVDEYSMSDFETPAVLYRDDASSDTSSDPPGDSEGHIIALCNLLDKSTLSPFMWVNGVYDHHADHYLPFRAPRLIPMWSRNHSVLIGGDSTDLSSMGGVVMGVRPAGFIERLLTMHYASSIDSGTVDSLGHGADSVLLDVAISDKGNAVLLNGVQSTALTADLSDSSVSDSDDDDLFFDNVRASSATRRSMVQPSNRISQRDKYRSRVTATVSTATAASNDIRSATELKTEDSTDILLKQAKFNEEQKAAAAKKRNLRSVQHRQFMRQQTLLTDRNVKRDLKNTPTNTNASSSSSSNEINIEPKQPAAVSNDDDDEFFYPIFDKD